MRATDCRAARPASRKVVDTARNILQQLPMRSALGGSRAQRYARRRPGAVRSRDGRLPVHARQKDETGRVLAGRRLRAPARDGLAVIRIFL